MSEWTHVQLAGDKLEIYISGDDASVSPNAKQVTVKVTEKTAHLLVALLQEKLELQRKLNVLLDIQRRVGDSA